MEQHIVKETVITTETYPESGPVSHQPLARSLPLQRDPTVMDSTTTDLPHEKLVGIEVLSFDHVELTKSGTAKNSFIGVDTLRVFYYPEYDRFLLILKDWEYALLKRLPVTSSSRTDMNTRVYTFPTYGGFYTAKFTKFPYPEALQNFETILAHTTRFSYASEDLPVLQNELSPDVSLIEDVEGFESSVISSQSSFSKGTPTGSFVDKDPLKLHGKDKFKRSFAKFADKLTGHHAKKTAHVNLYLTQVMDFESMRSPNVDFAPCEPFGRKEVEHAIRKSKDIAYKMHFGASPNSVQIINRDVLAQSLATASQDVEIEKKSRIQEQSIMTESVELVSHNGLMVSKEEVLLITEIEKVRALQIRERSLQDEHRKLELFHIDKERELREILRTLQDEKRLYGLTSTEERFRIEIDKKDDVILEQARIREAELTEWARREKELVDELERRLAELRAKDIMSEDERIEFARKEQELLEVNARLEAAKKEAELRAQEVAQEAHLRNVDLTEREKLTAEELARLREREAQLELETKRRIEELEAKEKLTETERLELIEKRDVMTKLIGLKEAERIQIEKEQQELFAEAARTLEELRRREELTEAERLLLEQREKEIEAEHERVLAELKAREFLTEEQRRELEEREAELKRMSALREAERVEFVRRQKEFQAEANRRETELLNREQLTEAERIELENLRFDLQKKNIVKEIELKGLIERREELLREAERRELEINQRLNLTEAEYDVLILKEKEFEAETQRILAELKIKEELTEAERLELHQRERELENLYVMRQVEYKAKQVQLEKIRQTEAQLLAQNKAIIEGHKQMNEEIVELKEELEKPVETVIRETVIVEKKNEIVEDVTQV